MIIAGVALLLLAFAHELSWWRKRDWDVVSGRVVGLEDIGNDAVVDEWVYKSPHIEYSYAGSVRRLRSGYADLGSGEAVLGEEVEVRVDPNSDAAEHFSPSNRWFFTAVPGVLGIAFVLIGLG